MLMRKRNVLIHHLLLTTALGSYALFGYGRRAYAGSCTGAGGTYTCSGAADSLTDTTITLSGAPLDVNLDYGFGVDTSVSGGDAFNLNGNRGLNLDASTATISITGDGNGVSAYNNGGGILSITTTGGAVTGNTYDGINATNSFSLSAGSIRSSLSITTGDVTGADNGIVAHHSAYGLFGSDLTINSSAGSIQGNGGTGIFANSNGSSRTFYGSANLSVTTAAVTGNTYGIYATNNGYSYGVSSNLTVSATGTVTGTNADGILVKNYGSTFYGSSNLSVTTANVYGGNSGIRAFNYSTSKYLALGASNLTITTGNVTGAAGDGIYANNYSGKLGFDFFGSSNLTVTTGDVTGGTNGIKLKNNGSSYANESNLTLTTGNVTGAYDGINALNKGSGYRDSNMTIDTSAGTVTGTANQGIVAANFGNSVRGSSNLTVTAGAVAGATDGIYAVNNGVASYASDLTITATGGAVTGTTGEGIFARNLADGATAINVTNSADVRGGTTGIYAAHASAGAFTIDIDNGGRVSNLSGASSDLAINAESTGSGLTLTTGATATIIGTVNLTDQDDVFNNGGTWDSAGGTNDFGAGYDVLRNTSSLTLTVGNGAANQTTYMNNLELFANSGRVDFADGQASDTLTISGDFDGSGSGVLQMDVYMGAAGAAADLFVIKGNVVGGPTDIQLFSTGGSGGLTGNGQNDGIALVDVSNTGGVAEGDFQLSKPISTDLFYYGNLVLGTDSVLRVQSTYLPTIPAWEVVPELLLGLMEAPGYRARQAGRTASGSKDGGPKIWLRTGGGSAQRDSEGSATGTTFERTESEVAAGVELDLSETLAAGVSLNYAGSGADVASPHGDSTVETTGVGAGLSLTWRPGGGATYVDAQARYMSFDSTVGNNGEADGSGVALELEVGHSVPLGPNWSVTPHGGIAFAQVDFEGSSGFGESASSAAAESMKGRLGVSLDRNWAGSSVYGSIGVSHEFSSDVAVDVAAITSTTFERSAEPTRFELGIGGSVGFGAGTSLYGSVDLSTAGDTPDMAASAGVRFQW